MDNKFIDLNYDSLILSNCKAILSEILVYCSVVHQFDLNKPMFFQISPTTICSLFSRLTETGGYLDLQRR